ncbi:MAG: pyridoxal-phosphate dependent enzyme, partial [Tenericutes bacterium]|nr:pyridoxal-phosphate dependent enzyme [Mycoplasmatota bacterium]
MKKIEKVNTSFLPTPLHKLENISKDFKGYNIYIKRDDLTGIGAGGNKLRKLDYIVKKALDEGYTTILTYGGVQTNHGRLTAAACARF